MAQPTIPAVDPQTLAAAIRARAAADPAYIARLFQIESGGNPNVVTGSNRGLGQFGPREEARYGISDANRGDYGTQAAAVEREYAEHAVALKKALGRDPTHAESYLTHQQGIAGGPALLTADPSMPAWQAIRRYYKSDAIARQAITGNIPGNHPLRGQDADRVTVGDFRNLWTSKFDEGGNSNARGPVPSVPSAGGAGGAPVPAAPTPPDQVPPGSPSPESDEADLLQAQTQAGDREELTPAPPMPFPSNALRLRNAMAGRMGQGGGGPALPPSVAQRLATLIGRG